MIRTPSPECASNILNLSANHVNRSVSTALYCCIGVVDVPFSRYLRKSLEVGATIEPQAGNAHHGKRDRQHIAFLPGWKVTRCAIHRVDG